MEAVMLDLTKTVADLLPDIEACEDRAALEATLDECERVTVRRAIEERLAEVDYGAEPEEEAKEVAESEPAPVVDWPTLRARMEALAPLCAAVVAPVPHPDTPAAVYRDAAERAEAVAAEARDIADLLD